MYTIDVILQYSPMPISVQRKEAEDADALYKKITEAMRSSTPILLELTCEKQPEKKVALLSNLISAAVVSQKSGAAASGRVPGFFADAQA